MADECTLWTKDGKLIKNSKGELILSRSCPCVKPMCQAYYMITTGTPVAVACAGGTKYNIPKTYTLRIIKSTENIPSGGTQVGLAFECGTTTMSINVPEHYTWKCPSNCTCGFVIDKISVTRKSTKTYVCPNNEVDTGVAVYDYELKVVPEKANYGDPGAVPACVTRKYTITTEVANGCVAQSEPSVGSPINLWVLDSGEWYDVGSTSYPVVSSCSNGKPHYTYEFRAKEEHYLVLHYYDEYLNLVNTVTTKPMPANTTTKVDTCAPPTNGTIFVAAYSVVQKPGAYKPTTTDKKFSVTLTSSATRSITIPDSVKTLSTTDVVKPTINVTCTPTKNKVSQQQILISSAKAGDKKDVTIYVAQEP